MSAEFDVLRRRLDVFVLQVSDDPVKTDLELVCSGCETYVCDAEDGDSLAVLAGMAMEHTCAELTAVSEFL